MNEIKTLKEIGRMVNTGHEIILLSTVMQDGVEYLVMQDDTNQTHYSVSIEI